jgi:hypothetical protein
MSVYNFEFPSYVKELKIGNYLFQRTEDYPEAFSKLEHRVHSDGGEFPTRLTTGSHQVTATVQLIDANAEPSAALPWAIGHTQLEDILLLFELFTGRNVFAINRGEADGAVITRDPRASWYGAALHCAIEYETVAVNDPSGWLMYTYDVGFEKTMNKILDLISSSDWHQKYDDGHFLLIYRAAMTPQIIEVNFILCWTVWNQVFSAEHRNILTDIELWNTSEKDKIAYVFRKYFVSESMNQTAMDAIERLCRCRHRVVHIGKKTENVDTQEMVMFVRATEFLITKVLGLKPSDLFGTWEKLALFLKGNSSN